MDTEPVACDSNTIFALGLGGRTFVPPCSTDNRGKIFCKNVIDKK